MCIKKLAKIYKQKLFLHYQPKLDPELACLEIVYIHITYASGILPGFFFSALFPTCIFSFPTLFLDPFCHTLFS